VSEAPVRAPHALARAVRSFRLEWFRELRRQAGDESLPTPLRARLRDAARRGLARVDAERIAATEGSPE